MNNTLFKNIIFLSVLSCLLGVLLLLVGVVISHHIPFTINNFVKDLFPLSLYDVRPERDMLFFRCWVVLAVCVQGVLVGILRERLTNNLLIYQWWPYMAMISATVVLSSMAAFKYILWNASWAGVLLCCVLFIGILGLVFLEELRKFINSQMVVKVIQAWQGLPLISRIFIEILLVWSLIWLLIFPDQAILYFIGINDQFYHIDSLLASPGLAHLKGLLLNVDVTSQYSVLIPIIISRILNGTVGFDYSGLLYSMVAIALLYYLMVYVFLRVLTKNILLALTGLIFLVKWQMFHWGVVPIVWQYPSATPLRYWIDIVVIALLMRHSVVLKNRYLYIIGVLVGIAVCWMMDIGVYLTAAIMFYLIFLVIHQRISMKLAIIVLALIPVTAVSIIFMIQPASFFNPRFWQGYSEFASLFIQGWGALPLTEGLKDKQYLAWIVGLSIPVIYLAHVIVMGLRSLFNESNKYVDVAMSAIGIYGLGTYHYYIHRSGVTSYEAVIMPFVLISIFWINQFIKRVSPFWQRCGGGILLFVSMTTLLTAHFFTITPNLLNISKINYPKVMAAYRDEFNLSLDADLIKKLTHEDERVALISSFETLFLMQANRKPYFYYFPLIESSLLNSTLFRGTYIHTTERLQKILTQLNNNPPRVIFVETKLFETPLAAEYQQKSYSLKAMLTVVSSQYDMIDKGKYLTAFSRKK